MQGINNIIEIGAQTVPMVLYLCKVVCCVKDHFDPTIMTLNCLNPLCEKKSVDFHPRADA